MPSLYIDRKGSELKLKNSALAFYENEERIGTIPLAPIDRIYLKGDVKLNTSLLAKLGEKNIGIICLSGRKNTPTLFMPQPHKDASRRLAQYHLANDETFCLLFAKQLIHLKLTTHNNWLWQAADIRPDKKILIVPKALELNSLIAKIFEQSNLSSLRGIEGRAANAYFGALSLYLPGKLRFQGRNRRPPQDPFNAVLSLGYTLVHSEAVLAAYGAGLDPYIGFYHSLNYGRESLACDLIEPLRPLIDNWIIGCFRQNILREEYFSTTQEGCLLGKTGRINFYREYEKQVSSWRKILTESCYTLSNLFKTFDITNYPQSKSRKLVHENKIIYELNWKKILNTYTLKWNNLLSETKFHF